MEKTEIQEQKGEKTEARKEKGGRVGWAERRAKRERGAGTEENVVFVGGKPFMNYVTSLVMQFTEKGAPEVVLKARGKFISKAVDVAEYARDRFFKDQLDYKEIKLGSEAFTGSEGRAVRVSTIEITLAKK